MITTVSANEVRVNGTPPGGVNGAAVSGAVLDGAVKRRVVQDVRGYGPAVVQRLCMALDSNAEVLPDPRHPHALVVEFGAESFYIVPLSAGRMMLLGHWAADSV
jgi:hypothetical protein